MIHTVKGFGIVNKAEIDALEKEMATHSSNLAWKIPWKEETGGLQPMGLKESDMTYILNHHHHSDIY